MPTPGVLNVITAAYHLLDRQQDARLIADCESVLHQFSEPCFRIAVLAPFNFGKSTLLNALLGKAVLPVKGIRTTGIAIKIRYGKRMQVRVIFKNGQVETSEGVGLLQEFATLSKGGIRREGVASVEVYYPHPLLKRRVEIFDLPGTNDSPEQDKAVRDRLLQVDLVIQVLNASQPLTMREQDELREWLIERGISTVMFAINWMNVLESREDRKEVYADVYATTNRFRTHLPGHLWNLYCVDAKPALEAKQKRKLLRAFCTGVIPFEAALYTIIFFQKQVASKSRLPRIIAIATKVKQKLQTQSESIALEIQKAEVERTAIISQGREQEQSLRNGLDNSLMAIRDWLSFPNLAHRYQNELALALQNSEFESWQDSILRPKVNRYIQSVEGWIRQACHDFDKDYPGSFSIYFPRKPIVDKPNQDTGAVRNVISFFRGDEYKKEQELKHEYREREAYIAAANSYLRELSRYADRALQEYENKVRSITIFPIPPESPMVSRNRTHLQSLNSAIARLQKIEVYQNTYGSSRVTRLSKLYVTLTYFKYIVILTIQFCLPYR